MLKSFLNSGHEIKLDLLVNIRWDIICILLVLLREDHILNSVSVGSDAFLFDASNW